VPKFLRSSRRTGGCRGRHPRRDHAEDALVILNNPLNPAAVVYPREDLEMLGRICEEFDLIAICDEVWEHVVFDGRAHIPLIAIPGMRERTVKIGSAGKMFGLTGWKVGFVCAAPHILRVLAKAHQFITFTTPPNLQVAVAYGLGKPDDYFFRMRADLARSRDRLSRGLSRLGFPVLQSQGTYFLNVDLAPLGRNESDVEFCKRIVHEHKVAAIPVSAFYEENHVTSVVRFCFSKRDETLDTALERLSAFFTEEEADVRWHEEECWFCVAAVALAAIRRRHSSAREFLQLVVLHAPGVQTTSRRRPHQGVYDTFDATRRWRRGSSPASRATRRGGADRYYLQRRSPPASPEDLQGEAANLANAGRK